MSPFRMHVQKSGAQTDSNLNAVQFHLKILTMEQHQSLWLLFSVTNVMHQTLQEQLGGNAKPKMAEIYAALLKWAGDVSVKIKKQLKSI